jgi:FkbM family methyltransferase
MFPTDGADLVQKLPAGLRRHRLFKWAWRLWPGDGPILLTYNDGCRVFGDPAEAWAVEVFLRRVYYPQFVEIASPFLSPGAAVFDVGANIGLLAFALLRRWPDLHLTLFEPLPANQALLYATQRLYDDAHISIVPAAVADAPGRLRFHADGEHGEEGFVSADGGLEVDGICLDDFMTRQAIGTVAFTKLDVEGSEPRVLDGAKRSIAAGLLPVLLVEISSWTLGRSSSDPANLTGKLRELGYQLFLVRDEDLGQAAETRLREIRTGRGALRAVAVGELTEPCQTDVLAVHRTAIDSGTIAVA